MEDAVGKDQSSAPTASAGRSAAAAAAKLLRYPLRSATKAKEVKTPAAEPLNSSAPRRGRPAASVSKSVSVLEISGKDKSAKPPRRLSIPAKSTASPAPKLVGNITPISEARAKRTANSQEKSDTPGSTVSRSTRKKFSVLSSASYWLNQIKLSETADKHSISIGFFKLALEAGCEPLQRIRDELKSYSRRHNLAELGASAKEIFESYDILENLEQLQVSETCSQFPEEGTRSSDDDVLSSSSITGTQKPKPKSLNTDAGSSGKESVKETIQKNKPVTRTRASANKNSGNVRSTTETGVHKTQRKTQKPSKQETYKEDKVKKQGKKSAHEELKSTGQLNPSPVSEALEEDKENTEAPQMEEISLTEV